MPAPLLAAALIVRDEAARLAACLAGLAGLVDEVVVYDTGSVDGSVRVAREAGARVITGAWVDDFAAARNAALDLTDAQWVLSVDADEQVQADPVAVRALLAGATADVLTVAVRSECPEELGGPFTEPALRLLRPDAAGWTGVVAEHPVPRGAAEGRQATSGSSSDPALVSATCPASVLRIEHAGFREAALVRSKALRNVRLAERALAAGTGTGAGTGAGTGTGAGDPVATAGLWLVLGQGLVALGRPQSALGAFTRVRELLPGGPLVAQALEGSAGLLLAEGRHREALDLVEVLRAAGGRGPYCDWLQAQALAPLGAAGEALELLRRVGELVDAGGRELDFGQVVELRGLVAALAGERDEAVACLAVAMIEHGRAAGRGPLLLQLWGPDAPAALADVLLAMDAGHLVAVARELSHCGPPGPEVASTLLHFAAS